MQQTHLTTTRTKNLEEKKQKKPQLFDTCPLIAPKPQAPLVALDMPAQLWYSYRSQHEFKFSFNK
jgi:hypothetical protein